MGSDCIMDNAFPLQDIVPQATLSKDSHFIHMLYAGSIWLSNNAMVARISNSKRLKSIRFSHVPEYLSRRLHNHEQL